MSGIQNRLPRPCRMSFPSRCALSLALALVGCGRQPATETLLDERTDPVADDDLVTVTTQIGPPEAPIPMEASFVVGRDGCDAVDQLVVRRTGGTEALTLSNATGTRGDCGRSPRGRRGRPTLVRIDWSGFMGCKRLAAEGDGFQVWPDGHVEPFMLQQSAAF